MVKPSAKGSLFGIPISIRVEPDFSKANNKSINFFIVGKPQVIKGIILVFLLYRAK